MSDDFTTTGSLGTDQAAYEALAYFALREELFFFKFADVKPTRQTHTGSSVIFRLFGDMAIASTSINESVDIDAAALTDDTVTVTLDEFGNGAVTTAKLRNTSYIEIDPVVANVVGWNAGESFDTIHRDVLKAGSNVRYATGAGDGSPPTARNLVEPEDTLTAHDVRRARADLRGNQVQSFGGYYAAAIHPDVSLDLREETGVTAWREPHVYSQPAEIWNGEIGAFEQFRFFETDRAPVFADAGSSTTLTDVYATLFFGRQALAKAWSTKEGNGAQPRIVLGPVTDRLRRFQPVGWYWLGGLGLFRQAALRRVESSSSIGNNAP